MLGKTKISNGITEVHPPKKMPLRTYQYSTHINKPNSAKPFSNSNDNNKNDHIINGSIAKGPKGEKLSMNSNINNYFS
jgi:hypothetical protein